MTDDRDAKHLAAYDRQVFMMGEELKKPLTAIKALAESKSAPKTIMLEAQKALRTIDNMLLNQQIASEQLQLDIEPVHVGSTLTQVAYDLEPLSIERGCETEVYIQSGITTVDADRAVLKSGLESLWQAMLGMTKKPTPLSWQIYRSPRGIRVMLLNSAIDMSSFSLQDKKHGYSKQPFSGIAGPATDLVTARDMFAALGSELAKVHKQGRQGLAVTLKPSQQLALV